MIWHLRPDHIINLFSIFPIGVLLVTQLIGSLLSLALYYLHISSCIMMDSTYCNAEETWCRGQCSVSERAHDASKCSPLLYMLDARKKRICAAREKNRNSKALQAQYFRSKR